MTTIDVKDAAGLTVAIERPLAPGRASASASRPVALSTEDSTTLTSLLSALSGTLNVAGSFYQATQPVSLASVPTHAVTQSGSWNVGLTGTLPAFAATPAFTLSGTAAATQSGTWTIRTQDGSGNALTSRAAGSARAIDVAIVDGSGVQITSFGGGGSTGPVQGAVTTAAPTYTTGTNQNVSLTTAGALRVDGSASTQPVSGTFWQATQPVSNAGTFAVQVSAAIPTGANVIGKVSGDTATGATFPTNPVGSGMRAATSSPTAVSNGQLVAPMADSLGRAITKEGAPADLDWFVSIFPTTTTNTTLKAAAGSGLRNYITSLTVSALSTYASGGFVVIKDNNSPALFSLVLPAGPWPYTFVFPSPIRGSANLPLTVDVGTASAVFINATGYVAS